MAELPSPLLLTFVAALPADFSHHLVMEEWKYTLLNGLLATMGAIIVGCLALYGVLRQARKGQEIAHQQSLALLAQVDRNAVAVRDQARWESRRSTYAETLTACHHYLTATFAAGELLIDQHDENGEIVGSFNDEAEGRRVSETLDQLNAQINSLRLEGPAEVLDHVIEKLSEAAADLHTTLYVWSGLVHDGHLSNLGSDFQSLLDLTREARNELLSRMYDVLHQ